MDSTEQPELGEPTPAPVEPVPDPAPDEGTDADSGADDPTPESVSENTAGKFAVYDNNELRFCSGSGVHDTEAEARRERDDLAAETGHELAVIEV